MQDLNYIFAWAIMGLACFTFSLLFLGRQTGGQIVRDPPIFFAGLLTFLLVWPIAFIAAAYTGLRRVQMLRWMAERYQSRSHMTWDNCWYSAKVQFDLMQQWGDLTVFPTREWTKSGAHALTDSDLECWDGD